VSAERVTRVWHSIGLGVLVLALLASAYNGLWEGWSELHNDDTPPMRVATATQLLYGLAALLALVALALRPARRWVFPLLLVWAVATTSTATLAPIVYGGRPLGTGIAAGAITALIVALPLWLWRRACRKRS